MHKTILILLLISISGIQGQENKFVLSDLYGAWTFDHTEIGTDYDIIIYRRCGNNQKAKIHRFYSNGNFEILYNYQLIKSRKPRRCGNEHVANKPQNKMGTYMFDKEYQQLKFKSPQSKFIDSWNLIWIDKNSFGVKKNKPRRNKT